MSSSTIYNHRTLQPTVPPPAPAPAGPSGQHARLNDSFELIRREFDALASDVGLARSQRDDLENKIAGQLTEINAMRNSFYELEAQHTKIRQGYEEELARLRAELATLRPTVSTSGRAGPPLGPGGAYPPPDTPGYYSSRERERDRERERERGLDRDRTLLDREREREREVLQRERERERDRDRDRERTLDQREGKRFKPDPRMKPEYSPLLGNGGPPPKLPHPGLSSSSGLPPSQPAGLASPPHSSTAAFAAAIQPFPTPSDRKMTNPPSLVRSTTGPPPPPPSNAGFLDDLDLATIPPDLKKEGNDWFAVFNPKIKRTLDINLVHTLSHATVVCCVQFSSDGKYLATGCNRTAQIYDVKTGQKTCVLIDDKAEKAGDLYIRSVRFSPDGKFLATGAEDKQIRIWNIEEKKIRHIFDGHQQEIYSLDFSLDGRLIVSGSGDKTARIWDTTTGNSKVLTIADSDSLNSDAGVTSVAISPDGSLVAAGSLDTIVRIWDVRTGDLVERLKGHRDSVYSVVFTPDGRGIVSGSLDKTLKYWDVSGLLRGAASTGRPAKGECRMNFTGHKDYVLSVAVSHDGQWVVSGSKDRGVQFWDSRSAIVQCMLQGHKNSVISIDLNPAGNLLATGSGDNLARIWSYSTM